jgi:hypothetical protein
MARLGMYDHLDSSYPMSVTMSMRDLADKVAGVNYGWQRLLSELVRQRKRSPYYADPKASGVAREYRDHTDRLEALLEDGFF